MKTKNCESYFIIIDQIKDYFSQHINEFVLMAEVADSYNGCLNDDRLYSMSELNFVFEGQTPEYILERAFFGFDFAPWSLMSRSNFTPGAFNPNVEYFYFNGYGNLVSVREGFVAEYYSRFIDREHVEAIFEAWDDGVFFSDDDNDELDRLYMALAEFEE